MDDEGVGIELFESRSSFWFTSGHKRFLMVRALMDLLRMVFTREATQRDRSVEVTRSAARRRSGAAGRTVYVDIAVF